MEIYKNNVNFEDFGVSRIFLSSTTLDRSYAHIVSPIRPKTTLLLV